MHGGVIHLFSGSLLGMVSPASHYSELVGADIEVHQGNALEIGLNPEHEHALLVLSGDCCLNKQPLLERRLHYLGTHRSTADFSTRAGARLLLIGGLPFRETILMWWNFVARAPEEIAEARADWEMHRRFGEVAGYRGPRLAAPDLVRFARPNPVS
jgi:redox-sensitive bicupin YhaK (pirin superfamily)